MRRFLFAHRVFVLRGGMSLLALSILIAAAFGRDVEEHSLDSDSNLISSPETLVNGVEFRLISNAAWTVRSAQVDEATSSFISLRMTNRTNQPIYFNRFDTFRLGLADSKGGEFGFDGGRDATKPAPALSSPIAPGATHEIQLPARLENAAVGEKRRLIGSEDFGGIWYFDPLAPGKYFLRGIYENEKSKIGDKAPVWTGVVETPPLPIEVK